MGATEIEVKPLADALREYSNRAVAVRNTCSAFPVRPDWERQFRPLLGSRSPDDRSRLTCDNPAPPYLGYHPKDVRNIIREWFIIEPAAIRAYEARDFLRFDRLTRSEIDRLMRFGREVNERARKAFAHLRLKK